MIDVDGIVLLDKPVGISSNVALQKTKRLLSAQKAGHTGSLDPLATGMLPICLGEATKFSRFIIEEDKRYLVTVRLGIVTSTGDKEGEIIKEQTVPAFTQENIQQALNQFLGHQSQIPPMFSAVKHQGQPLYKLARKGIAIERKPRPIMIHDLTWKDYQEDSFTLSVTCSKGTYIRTLVEDIGAYLGCGAHVQTLHRLWVAPFQEYAMSALDKLVVIPIREILAKLLPTIVLPENDAFKLSRGLSIPLEHQTGWIALLDSEGDFLGVGEILDNRLFPKRLKKCVSC